MSHFAQLDENNIVINVVKCDNNDPKGDEGYQWLMENLGGRWVQTSYNGNFRFNYAGIDYTYDKIRDAFIPIKPAEGEYTLDEDTCRWMEQGE